MTQDAIAAYAEVVSQYEVVLRELIGDVEAMNELIAGVRKRTDV